MSLPKQTMKRQRWVRRVVETWIYIFFSRSVRISSPSVPIESWVLGSIFLSHVYFRLLGHISAARKPSKNGTLEEGRPIGKIIWITRYDFDQSEPIDLSSGRKHFLIMHSFSTPRIRSDDLKSIGISTTRRQKAHRKDVFDYLIWFRLPRSTNPMTDPIGSDGIRNPTESDRNPGCGICDGSDGRILILFRWFPAVGIGNYSNCWIPIGFL